MPFITNDIKRLLVGKRQYNQNATEYVGYVIVRRLFLSSETPLARDELSSIFDDYNDFESIEISKNKIEGYVTFKTDIGAYIAWKEIEIEGVRIKPAYSWKQPKHKVATDNGSNIETTSPFLDLCDKLICNVLDFCDNETLVNLSETCKRLEGVLQKIHTYKRIDKDFLIAVDDDEYNISPADAHKMLKLMGKYFEKLTLFFLCGEEIDENDRDLIECYMHQATKYCTNIREMLLCFHHFKPSLIEPLHSTNFQNLHTLKLTTYHAQDDEVFDISFLQCPSLMALEIGYNVNIHLSKPWSSLQNLKLIGKYSDTFFENTPELKELEFFYYDDQFDDLSTRLPKLSKLTLLFRDDSLNQISSLSNLKNLEILTLYFFFSEPLVKIASVIPVLENLQTLKILVREGSKISDEITADIITIVRKCPNLERFELESLKLELEQVSQLKDSLVNLKSLELISREIKS